MIRRSQNAYLQVYNVFSSHSSMLKDAVFSLEASLNLKISEKRNFVEMIYSAGNYEHIVFKDYLQ